MQRISVLPQSLTYLLFLLLFNCGNGGEYGMRAHAIEDSVSSGGLNEELGARNSEQTDLIPWVVLEKDVARKYLDSDETIPICQLVDDVSFSDSYLDDTIGPGLFLRFSLGANRIEAGLEEFIVERELYSPDGLILELNNRYLYNKECMNSLAQPFDLDEQLLLIYMYASAGDLVVNISSEEEEYLWTLLLEGGAQDILNPQLGSVSSLPSKNYTLLQLEHQSDGTWFGHAGDSLSIAMNEIIAFGDWEIMFSVEAESGKPMIKYLCDPYSKAHDYCGYSTKDGDLEADPPNPIEILFSYSVNTEENVLELEILDWSAEDSGWLVGAGLIHTEGVSRFPLQFRSN